jgi:hypothetical protein
MQDLGDVRVVKAVDTDGEDGVVTCLPTTCKPQEQCSLCLDNSFLMKEAQHRSHLHNNKIATQMCVSHVDLTLRMATHTPHAHSTR